MKKQVLRVSIFFVILMVLLSVGFYMLLQKNQVSGGQGEARVLLMEIRELTADENGMSPAEEQIEMLLRNLEGGGGASDRAADAGRDGIWNKAGLAVTLFVLFSLFYMAVLLLYVYQKMLRPFEKLQGYAGQVAAGNLDVALDCERTNFFGAFTWAFDHMREELKAARRREETAIQENKTIIATLSHDIKTPIASVRAYAEGLEANLSASYEKRESYIQVILRKCDEVTALTNDLVLHSLSQLDKLEIGEQRLAAADVLKETVHDLGYTAVELREPLPRAQVIADARRLAQVIENLLNNAGKYAPGAPVEVWADKDAAEYRIHIRDHGAGIPPEDMPFICDKFYRGHNAGEQPGSGLGLYIVSYILQRMHGRLELVNRETGLEAVIVLKTAENESNAIP